MCIIVSKEKGVDMPSREILENCFITNSDGAGYMYHQNGKVQIRKGFMTFDEFYHSIEKLGKIVDLKKTALVMHFRISTAGNVDKGNCHPYPIVDRDRALRATNYVTDLGMAHNGIISNYDYKEEKLLNDTQMFIKNVVSVLKQYDNNFLKSPKVREMLENLAESKLCFMDGKGNITYIGEFINDKGVRYSNSSYLDRFYYGGLNWGYYPDYNDSLYDEEIMFYDLMDKADAQEPLTYDEFNILFDRLECLEPNDIVFLSDGNQLKVGNNNWAIDEFCNLYSVDFGGYNIVLVDEGVDVIDGRTLESDLMFNANLENVEK